MGRPWAQFSLILIASAALADELPLPQQGAAPQREDSNLAKPSAIIKAPPSDVVVVPVSKQDIDAARERAILESERRLIEEEVQKQILFAQAIGNPSLLKKLILMAGPVDAAVSRAAKPPTAPEQPVALIGLEKDAVVGKNLEHFFGAPMTSDQEKALIDAVRSQLAGKEGPRLNVHIAGWWPDEGVMAVSVVPES